MKSLLVSLLFGALNVPQVVATCYNPDGSAITDVAYQPCNQYAGVYSMCCGTNHTGGVVSPDICLDNGLCQNIGDSVYWRQGCTDKTWKSPYCLSNLCTKKSQGGDPTDNVPVGQCADGSWCCGGSNQTCCNAKLGIVLAATVGISSTSSSSSSTSTSLSSSTGSSATSSPTTSPAISSTQSTSTNTPTNTSTSVASSGGLDSGAKIGIGIGVAGGVIAIIAVAGAFFVLRKHRVSAPDSTKGGLGQPFVSYHEFEAKQHSVEAPENIHHIELPNSQQSYARNVELAG